MNVPTSMRTAILYGQKDVRIETRPVPKPGPGEILIAVEAALTDGTDLKVYRRGYHAKMIRPPAPFGHEFAGRVAAVGPEVERWNVGDRVVAANSAPCGGCAYCLRDQESLCDDLVFVNGAYASFLLLPERIVRRNLLPILDGTISEAAALTEPLACVVKGIRDTDLSPGDTVAVLGSGPIGLVAVRLASRAGATVVLFGRRKGQLELGQQFGAAETYRVESETDLVAAIRSINGDQGPDRVFEATGVPAIWETAIAAVRRGGLVNLFGGCPAGTRVSFDTNRLHYDEVVLRSSFHHTPADIRSALELITNGEINPHLLFDGEEPLERLPQALQEMDERVRTLKTVIRP